MDYEVRYFQRAVIDASPQLPVAVDFRAAWRTPCRLLGPILGQLAATAQRRWKPVTLDVGAQQALAQQYQVRGIPTVPRLIDSHMVDQSGGAMPQSALVQWLARRIPMPVQRQATGTREHRSEAALGHFPGVIVGERGYPDDAARKASVALFELPGAAHPQLRDLRRHLQRAPH